MTQNGRRSVRGATALVGAGAVVLALAHQDVWFWNDRTMVLGFLPVGLAYHALFSLAAAGLWALAVRFAWPSHIEAWADEAETPAAGDGRGAGRNGGDAP